MDNKKFEKLIDLIINENEDQARALFHDIVVEKSREIYESMMDEELEEAVDEELEEGTEEDRQFCLGILIPILAFNTKVGISATF